MIELAQDNDTMTNSQDVVEHQTPQRNITVAKLNALYTSGMHLAQAMRQVYEVEAANDLEIWVLGMKHDLEQLLDDLKGEQQ